MKILFVYSTINSICTQKYCYDLSNALKKYLFTEVISYKVLKDEIVEKFDIIILQRIGDGTTILEEDKRNIFNVICKNKSKIFIYLVDDLVIESQGALPRELAKVCDGVMCSSNTLCENFKLYNKNVVRFNTFIDVDFYESISKNFYEKFTIAWVSIDGVGIDVINEIVYEKDSINIDFNLIAIGGQSYKLKKANYIKCYGIVSERKMIELIKGSDILLNPMTNSSRVSSIVKSIYKSDVNEFLNSKAEIKYLTAGMCHSCLLSSDIECYRETIINGVNGFILNNNSYEWITLIKSLYNNRVNLKNIKENAYTDVKENYDVNKIAKEIYIKLKKIEKND